MYIFLTDAASTPFLMVLSTPSAHAPFIPAPQYRGEFEGERAPRTPGESSSYSQGTPSQLALEIQLFFIVGIAGKTSCYSAYQIL